MNQVILNSEQENQSNASYDVGNGNEIKLIQKF